MVTFLFCVAQLLKLNGNNPMTREISNVSVKMRKKKLVKSEERKQNHTHTKRKREIISLKNVFVAKSSCFFSIFISKVEIATQSLNECKT